MPYLAVGVIVFWIIAGLAISCAVYAAYKHFYFNSEKFRNSNNQVKDIVDEHNNINHYLNSVRSHHNWGANTQAQNKLAHLNKNATHTYPCSLSVVRKAQNEPYRYVCKYFGIEPTSENIANFAAILNDYDILAQGVASLQALQIEAYQKIENQIPGIIRFFSKEVVLQQLGFRNIENNLNYFTNYKFKYVSDAGRSTHEFTLTMDNQTLEEFIEYLSDEATAINSAKGQRALMTPALRERIKMRDNYTCCICGISTHDTPSLLLEVDHIIPVSKGGKSTADNLQTLCWKCNRTKGAK